MTQRWLRFVLVFAILVGGFLLYIRILSPAFAPGLEGDEYPYIEFVIALTLSSLCWIGLIPLLQRVKLSGKLWLWSLICLGIIYRAVFFGSTPIYENDYNRYLWDGAVTLQGQNPYEYAPETTYVIRPETPQTIKDLRDLAEKNGRITEQIGYPELTTIYTPPVIAVFTLAAWIEPFDLDMLRILYLGFDLVALWLLFYCLKLYERDVKWALLYWLNPMLIYSVYNAAHMDVLLVPFLLAALLFSQRRPFLSAISIGMAAAIKFWPLILAPLLLRTHLRRPLVFVSAGALTGLICLILTSPLLLSWEEHNGLFAYSASWQKNSFLFSFLKSVIGEIFATTDLAARLCVAMLLASLSFWLALKPRRDSDNAPAMLLLLPLTLFLLAPASYPWYTVWFLPFLCFNPLYGAALLSATTPLYYLRYAMADMGHQDIFTHYIVPIEFGLPLLILMFEVWRSYRNNHYA